MTIRGCGEDLSCTTSAPVFCARTVGCVQTIAVKTAAVVAGRFLTGV